MSGSSSFFRLLDFQSSSIEHYPGVINGLWNNQVDGIIVRELITPSVASKFIELLCDSSLDLPRSNYYWGQVFGRVLTSQLEDLDQYFIEASLYESNLPPIWGQSITSWPSFFSELLYTLSGKIATVPSLSNSLSFISSTVRIISNGKELTTHCGNQFAECSSKLDSLSKISLLDDQVSYFLLLQEPSLGGELTVFDALWSNRSSYTRQGLSLIQSIESRDSLKLDLKVGDLLIFQGGQIYHRVECIHGVTPRITLGGFITPSHDLHNLYFWS